MTIGENEGFCIRDTQEGDVLDVIVTRIFFEGGYRSADVEVRLPDGTTESYTLPNPTGVRLPWMEVEINLFPYWKQPDRSDRVNFFLKGPQRYQWRKTDYT